ncbi:MAG: polymer-forming cytoskeletal protein [Chloroflexi bacterium]|nr:polymer-forming cytoskeletal protein [Chloroflexota bacterium]
MNRIRWALTSVLLLAALTALLAGPAGAVETRADSLVYVGPNEVIDGDLMAFGESVTIDGTVNGDVFAAAQSVTINGAVAGDLLAASQHVAVAGRIGGDVRAASQYLTVTGVVAHNLTAAAQFLSLTPSGQIGGSWMSAGATTTLDGTVGRDVTVSGDRLDIRGRVGRDVQATVDALAIAPSAQVRGGLTYTSWEPQPVPPGTVAGEVAHRPRPAERQRAESPVSFLSLIWLAGNLILGVLLVWLLPRPAMALRTAIDRGPLLSLGIGLVALIGGPLIAILLAITLVGLPLALLTLVAYLLGLLVGWIITGYALGHLIGRLVERQWHRRVAEGWLVMVGLLALYLLTLVPYLGGLVALVAILLGLGAWVLGSLALFRISAARLED